MGLHSFCVRQTTNASIHIRGKTGQIVLVWSTDYGATVTDLSSTVSASLLDATNGIRMFWFRFAQLSNDGRWFFYGRPTSGSVSDIYTTDDAGTSFSKFFSTPASNNPIQVCISDNGRYVVYLTSTESLVLVTDDSVPA